MKEKPPPEPRPQPPPARRLAAFVRKMFRPAPFAKYEVTPNLDAPAVERRLVQKMRSLPAPLSAKH